MHTTTENIFDLVSDFLKNIGDEQTLFIESKESFSITNGEFSIKHDGTFAEKKNVIIEELVPAEIGMRGDDIETRVKKQDDEIKIVLTEFGSSSHKEFMLKISIV